MKALEAHELAERIDEILRLIKEEGETIEVTNGREVVAHLIPVSGPQSSTQIRLTPFWEKMEQLAAEIDSYIPPGKVVDAVEIVRDGRREL